MEENEIIDNLEESTKQIAKEIIENNKQEINEETTDFDVERFNREVNQRIKEEIAKNNEQREEKNKKFDEEKHEMKNREILMDKTYDMLEGMKEIPHQTKLHNIAISYNNAKSEIEGMLKRKGKDPFRNSLYDISSWYLMDLLQSGLENLNLYISSTKKVIRLLPKIEITEKINYLEKYLKTYEDINSKICDFSIDKDAEKAFNLYRNHCEENGKNGGYNVFWDIDVNEYIEKCNNELQDLGFNTRIPYEVIKNENSGKKL